MQHDESRQRTGPRRQADRFRAPSAGDTLASELVDAAPDAIVLIDSQGKIVLVNKQVEVLFGYAREDLVDRPVELLVPDRLRDLHVQHREAYAQAPAARPMGHGQVLYGLRRDGTEFPAEISLSPVRSDMGLLVAAAIRDVTERQNATIEQARLLRQAEAAETMFRSLLEAAPDAMMIAGQDGRIALVNRQVEALFGYRRDELVGQPVEKLIPERFHTGHLAHRAEYQSAPRVRPMGEGLELFGRRKDGSEFPVEVSLSPVETDEGTLASASIRDLTGRRQVESAVRRQAVLLNLVPAAVLVRDPASAVQYWNAAAERLYGWTETEARGQVTHTLLRTIFSEPLPMIDQQLEASGYWEGELRHTRKDGRELIVMSRQALQRDQVGRPLAILEINTDVTGARQAEEALRQSEERFRLLLEGVQDYAILQLTPEGNVGTWNAAAERQRGYRADEIIGQHFSRFYLPEDVQRGKPDRLLQQAASEGRVEDEGWRVRRDGSRFWADVLITALRDEQGRLRGFVNVTRDVTERKEAEKRLQETAAELARSNAELEQFAYVASHDLQEPLRMVASYTQLLRRRYAGRLDEDADEFIGYAADGATRMQALINGLLTYARVGTRQFQLQPIDANDTVEQVIADLSAAIDESNAQLTREMLPTVMADAQQLHQLFQNLIANAMKFHGDAPPVVHISAQQMGPEWVFSVRDRGIGIEPQYLDRIFTIFQRLHTRDEYPGTGIGLAVCRKVVERLGGRIWVESQPGEGTTFLFTLRSAD